MNSSSFLGETIASLIVFFILQEFLGSDWFRQNPPRDEEDKQHETYLKHQTELQSLERFFRSGWFEPLSGLDGEALMKKIQEGGITR